METPKEEQPPRPANPEEEKPAEKSGEPAPPVIPPEDPAATEAAAEKLGALKEHAEQGAEKIGAESSPKPAATGAAEAESPKQIREKKSWSTGRRVAAGAPAAAVGVGTAGIVGTGIAAGAGSSHAHKALAGHKAAFFGGAELFFGFSYIINKLMEQIKKLTGAKGGGGGGAKSHAPSGGGGGDHH